MTASELIAHLSMYPPDTPVACRLFSEQVMLDAGNVSLVLLPVARPDGWVANPRGQSKLIEYVLITP